MSQTFDATINRVVTAEVTVTAADDVRFFWLGGIPYVVTSPVGKEPADLATLDEAAQNGLISLS
jgi:uncharacterized membrane-anchored protein